MCIGFNVGNIEIAEQQRNILRIFIQVIYLFYTTTTNINPL